MKITIKIDNGQDSTVTHSVGCNNDIPGAVAATQLALDTALTVAVGMGWVAAPQNGEAGETNGANVNGEVEAEVVEVG